MSCKICGRSACASWMHSAEQQEAWELVEVMDDRQLKSEVVDLRSEVSALKVEVADDAIALRDMMRERDAAEAKVRVLREALDEAQSCGGLTGSIFMQARAALAATEGAL
jgi:hypothetical protein